MRVGGGLRSGAGGGPGGAGFAATFGHRIGAPESVLIQGLPGVLLRIQQGRRAWAGGGVMAHNGTLLGARLPIYSLRFWPCYSAHDPYSLFRLPMRRMLHPCAGVHIHPFQRQWHTVVHAAGRSLRGVPKLPRAASCGLCGNSKSRALGSSRRPLCRLNLCAECAGFWAHPRPVKRRSDAPEASVLSS